MFCIGMCVKNSQFGLEYNIINNLKKLNSYFKNLQIIVAYDSSSDKSLEILKSFNEEYKNVHIYDVTELNVKITSNRYRTKRIANARNKIVEVIRSEFSNCEYFAMMDTNNYSCIGDINLSALDYIFENKDKWDSVSFDREAGYYDDWALSFEPFVYSFFHFEKIKHVVELMRKYKKAYIGDKKEGEFIPVLSAFNGFAIYKTNVFIECNYDDKINLNLFKESDIIKQVEIVECQIRAIFDCDCEHRHFHLQAIKNKDARIFICKKSLFKKIPKKPEGVELRGPA